MLGTGVAVSEGRAGRPGVSPLTGVAAPFVVWKLAYSEGG